MAIDRGNVHAFQEKVGSGNGLYLKPKDFEDSRKIRPILWLKDGKPIDVVMYLEGWINGKDDKGKTLANGKPVRFEPTDDIPELDWKMSSYMGGPLKAQTPKPGLAILGWDYQSKALKIAAISNVSPVKIISNMLSPTTEDGKENDFYIEDITQVDILIKKGEKDKDAWTITTKALKSSNLEPECLKALQDFQWSWEAFIACDASDDNPTKITYADVLEVINADKPAAKTTTAKTAPATNKVTKAEPVEETQEESSDFTYDENWKEMKTQKGAVLGEQTIEVLQGWKDTMSKMKADGKKVSEPLLNAILSGIKDLSDSSGQESDPAF